MKVLKIFGIVAGIHLAALIVILANPGCSSTSKPAPQPSDTVARTDPAPAITVPSMAPASPAPTGADNTAITPVGVGFNPDAPATYASSASNSSGSGVRFTPTRPNTPAASAVVTQPVENVIPATTYTVKAGDSLWTLQKKFHVPLKEIAVANNIKTSTPLHEGQKLLIPSKAVTATAAAALAAKAPTASVGTSTAAPSGATGAEPKNASTRPTSEEFTYVVKPGEKLSTIARKFDVRTRDLAVHNNISDPNNLRAGMELRIPGWQPTASGGKAGKGSSSGRASKSTPSTSAPAPTPTLPAEVPNILESGPSPSTPSSSPSATVPIINIDETPTTNPAPKS